MKQKSIAWLIGAVLACVLGVFGFERFFAGFEPANSSANTEASPPPITPTAGTDSTNQNSGVGPSGTRQTNVVSEKSAVVIGSFNIQVFGEKKMSNPNVMAILVDICRRFDVLAVQELRAKNQNVIPNFVRMLNANGSRFSFRVGPRQGYTSSKEQYVFIWNTNTIDLIQENWLVPDPKDLIHREPMVATFRCRTVNPQEGFTFSLANIHTDPHEKDDELNALADSFQFIRKANYQEDDIIVLGDFNSAPNRFGRFGSIENLYAVIPSNVSTNTAGNNCYDNIVFDRRLTAEFTGQAGVFDLTKTYRLTLSQAQEVSDHFPVWAVFRSKESKPYVATSANPGTRR
jgi:endonuclease/exonuclease/phosphatase family metal-dependent hydrolase